MLREVSLEEISDGRLYDLNDMVKAGCDDCRGCFACCCGMGESIVLDPFDLYRLTEGLGVAAGQLLAENLELHVVDGIILPNLKMAGEDERCSFLNEEGRCSVHPYRPGICRLFPLGRYYENGTFRYFLQVHECKKENRTKVKVRKWIDTPEPGRYEPYIADWHYFLKGLQEQLTEENARDISMYVLKQFYLQPYEKKRPFFEQFSERLAATKEWAAAKESNTALKK